MSLIRFYFFFRITYRWFWWIIITISAPPSLGYGGGFNERENVEYIEREESDGEYDEVRYTLVCRLNAT